MLVILSIPESEARRSQVGGQPGLHTECDYVHSPEEQVKTPPVAICEQNSEASQPSAPRPGESDSVAVVRQPAHRQVFFLALP